MSDFEVYLHVPEAQYDECVGKLLMCSKGLSGALSDCAIHFIRLPLTWGGSGAHSSASSCGQAFIVGWVLVSADLELLYPGVAAGVHGPDGTLAGQSL